MAVTEGYIQGPVDPGGAGKKVDTTTVSQTDGGTVHREGAAIADPETLDARAGVLAFMPGPFDYGLSVRAHEDREQRRRSEIGLVEQHDQLLAGHMTRKERAAFTDRRGSVGRGSTR